MKPQPTWLRDHLIRAGAITETGASRRANIRTCPACRARILVGLDDIQGALEVRADPVPLSPLGEALAHLAGARTLALHREGGRFVLDRRADRDITKRPAGTADREDVVREHRCETGLTLPETAPTTFPEAAPPLPANAAPNF